MATSANEKGNIYDLTDDLCCNRKPEFMVLSVSYGPSDKHYEEAKFIAQILSQPKRLY